MITPTLALVLATIPIALSIEFDTRSDFELHITDKHDVDNAIITMGTSRQDLCLKIKSEPEFVMFDVFSLRKDVTSNEAWTKLVKATQTYVCN